MIAITQMKIDDRGRITFPQHFLKANNIKPNSYVEICPVYNHEDSVRVRFTNITDEETGEKNDGV